MSEVWSQLKGIGIVLEEGGKYVVDYCDPALRYD